MSLPSNWYTLEESAALLRAIFPNYPDLQPRLPAPSREQIRDAITNAKADARLAGLPEPQLHTQ